MKERNWGNVELLVEREVVEAKRVGRVENRGGIGRRVRKNRATECRGNRSREKRGNGGTLGRECRDRGTERWFLRRGGAKSPRWRNLRRFGSICCVRKGEKGKPRDGEGRNGLDQLATMGKNIAKCAGVT